MAEVLFIDRLLASPPRSRLAGDAAAMVRQTRFHARARIPDIALDELVTQLASEPVAEVCLPGPHPYSAVGNANYYAALAAVVRAVDPTTVLEFGTYLGIGTLTIALNARSTCRIITVDLPDEAAVGDVHALNASDRGLVARGRHRVGEAFLGTRFADRITQVRADSLTWRAEDTVSSVDLILIDGGHSAPAVRTDSDNALRVLAPGGTILWDDYFHQHPDVVHYLDDLAASGHRLRNIGGTNLVISDSRLS